VRRPLGRGPCCQRRYADVGRDMDVLRSGVGTPTLTYLRLLLRHAAGLPYASVPGQIVRPWCCGRALDRPGPVEESVARGRAFQRCVEGVFAAWCGQQPSCPLGADAGDPKVATANYAPSCSVLRKPVALAGRPQAGYGDAQTAVIKAMYRAGISVPLPRASRSWWGGKGEMLMRLADAYSRGPGTASHATCRRAAGRSAASDDQASTDPAARWRSAGGRCRRAVRDTGRGRARPDACAFWPVPPPAGPPAQRAGLPPVVVVSTTVTRPPYPAGVERAKAARAAASPCRQPARAS